MELLDKDQREKSTGTGTGHQKRKSFSRTMSRNPRVEVEKVLGGGLGKKDRKNFALLILLCESTERIERGEWRAWAEGRRRGSSSFTRRCSAGRGQKLEVVRRRTVIHHPSALVLKV